MPHPNLVTVAPTSMTGFVPVIEVHMPTPSSPPNCGRRSDPVAGQKPVANPWPSARHDATPFKVR